MNSHQILSGSQRRPTRTVFVGSIGIGGLNPIRIQSMTTSDTKDTDATVAEIEALVKAGCEIVRLTIPTKADCANLKNIRTKLKQKRIYVPLVADIHFTPSIAMDAVDFVEKIRINPGNFVDKKLFKTREYTETEYQQELALIEDKFSPLVEKCKTQGVAMRIGTNHGSLSDRIMNRYGDTPEGMVESALEFLRIAIQNNYHDIVCSMKASNTQVMVNTYRLLALRMQELNMNYPFHLGVTEAGNAEDGRIKSAVGIGTLLEEGIGDTIRVSLTEDSIHEIPVAGLLAAPYNKKFYISLVTPKTTKTSAPDSHRFHSTYERRLSSQHQLGDLFFGQNEPLRVWTAVSQPEQVDEFIKTTVHKDIQFEGVETTVELYKSTSFESLKKTKRPVSVISHSAAELYDCVQAQKIVYVIHSSSALHQIESFASRKDVSQHLEVCFDHAFYPLSDEKLVDDLLQIKDICQTHNFDNISFSLITNQTAQAYRLLAHSLDSIRLQKPIHLRYHEQDTPAIIEASTQLGALILDGIGDSLQIASSLSFEENLSLSYSLLQACRARISKTEFIACPSCGRTLFDLQKVTAKIKEQTSHLKGVKIAIMGCIVNGPGEMADADFGYVGTGPGKISLYVGQECVTRNIPEAEALAQLINLIKQHNKWVDK